MSVMQGRHEASVEVTSFVLQLQAAFRCSTQTFPREGQHLAMEKSLWG